MLGPNKPSIPGVGKFRKNIKNLKKKHPIRNHSLFISWGMGVSEDFGRITQFSVVTERGSEYNIVERENSRKMTANGGGGVITILQSPGGLLQYYRALGGGGERESGKFYLTQPKPSHPPPFLGNKERTPY